MVLSYRIQNAGSETLRFIPLDSMTDWKISRYWKNLLT